MATTLHEDEDNYQQNCESSMDIDICNNNEENPELQQMAIETKTTSRTHSINWAIDHRSLHIAKLASKGDKRGVIEATVMKDGLDFKLELCASGWRNSQGGYCAFYLTVPNQNDLFVARYKVQVGECSRLSSIRHDFQLGVGFPNFCDQTTLENNLVNGVINFLITIEIFTCESKIKSSIRPSVVSSQQLQPEHVVAVLMKNMYRNRLHADVQLVCRDVVINVHKAVLCHSSPVFRAMFSHNLMENSSNHVNMSDWEPHIVDSFVKFLYCAEVDVSGSSSSKNSNNNNNNHNNNKLSKPLEVKNNDNNININLHANNHNDRQNTSTDMIFGLEIDENKSSSFYDFINSHDNTIDERNNNENGNNHTVNHHNETFNSETTEHSNSLSESEESENIIVTTTLSPTDNQIKSIVSPSRIRTQKFVQKAQNCENQNSKIRNSLFYRTHNALSCNNTFKLLELGEFYRVESLIIACCHKMHCELTASTACDLLICLSPYEHVKEIHEIQESIWLFVTENIREIKKSTGYEVLMKQYPTLLGKLVDKITK